VRRREPGWGLSHCRVNAREQLGQHSCPFLAALQQQTLGPLEAGGQTEPCCNEKENMVKKNKGRIVLLVVAIVASQISPAHLIRALAEGQTGVASVYSTESGSGTASGQKLNPEALTAAHRTLPFGTKVRVTNRKNGRSVVVTINDRGPFVGGRVIDLTPAAARELGFSGLTQVSLDILGREREPG
jgi:rare lipoprotein A